jgi:hypothetical protein
LFVYIATTLKALPGKSWLAPTIATLLIISFFSFREVRGSLYTKRIEDPQIAREIGEIVDHSTHTVFVSYYYGFPLQYYGEFGGAPWPVRIEDPFYRLPDEKERSVQERLDTLGFNPEYFIITNFDLYNRKHQDLKVYLEENCSINRQTDQYLIYGSCHSTTTMLTTDNALIP